MFYAMLIGT